MDGSTPLRIAPKVEVVVAQSVMRAGALCLSKYSEHCRMGIDTLNLESRHSLGQSHNSIQSVQFQSNGLITFEIWHTSNLSRSMPE
jgi:hypothetical protein